MEWRYNMKIKLKRGLSSNITSVNLDQGEPAFCTDTGKLYVGDGTQNILINPDGGTATEAAKLSVARKISLDGDASGNVSFDGSADVTLSVTVADDSHNHVIANIDGLQTALNDKLSIALKGANSGLAELDSNGKIPSAQLPSFVDDVLEFESQSNFPTTGESGKIYIAIDTGKTYRWSGSVYTVISETIALGETSTTAYRGDYGKIAYTHSQSAHAPSDATKNDTDANLKNRANHTGTQLASTISDFANTVRGTVLTGLSTATSTVISATDTLLIALGKLQGQIGLKASTDSPTFTGTPKTTTAAKGTNTTQIASTAYVMTALGDYVKTTDTIDGGTF
jgi:hypothetical protein